MGIDEFMKQKSLKINAILNVIKQGCSIVFPLITFPYVSRVFGAKGFGQYNFSFSVADYFIIFAALGIQSYAIREGSKHRDSKEITNRFCCEVFTINFIATVISFLVLLLTLFCIKSFDGYRILILVISSQMLLATVGADWVNSIYEDYLYITIRYIAIQLLALILIFVFVHSENDVLTYSIIVTFASAGGNLLNIIYIRRYTKLKLVFSKKILRHLRPILILFANTMAISIYVNADITMLKFYQDDTIVGLYSLSSRIYNILKRLVSAMVLVTTARLAYYAKNDKQAYMNVCKKTINGLFFILMPCMVGMLMMSGSIIRLVGGAEYAEAWLPLAMLSFAMFFALLSCFYSNCVLVIFSADEALLTATCVSAASNVILNFFLLGRFGMYGTAITTIIAEAVNLIIQFHYSKRYVVEKLVHWPDLIKVLLGALLILIICYIVNNFVGVGIRALTIAIPASCIAYFGFNFITRNATLLSLIHIKKR